MKITWEFRISNNKERNRRSHVDSASAENSFESKRAAMN